MDERAVLVVSEDRDAESILEETLADGDRSMAVRVSTDPASVHHDLCTDVVHCLIVDREIDGTSGIDVARSVDGFFPNLPVIVVGDGPDERERSDEHDDVPDRDGVPATVVAAESVVGDPDIEAVVATLEDGVDSAAARPPSRMETLLLSLVDQLPAHVFVKDREARHVYTNDYQVSREALLGLTDLAFDDLPDRHREAAYHTDLRVIEEGEPHLDVEEFPAIERSDRGGHRGGSRNVGRFRDVKTSKVPWFDADGTVVGLAGVTHDVTDQKLRDHATRRQHERLAKLALVAAHELRNELQVALGRLQHVVDDPSQADAVEASLGRLSTITDDLVRLASQERLDRERTVVWLSSLCLEVWDALDAPDATCTVEGDRRLRTYPESAKLLVELLLENSIEHGGADVTITIGATDDGFSVEDDGSGIEVEPANRVFDAAYTTKPDKTGFGLYVAARIAGDLGWSIDVAEGEGGGARFEVTGVT